ncbi:uncharacterized protein BDW43DRAFT_262097 [Aspergillus alliaceus]|uniref:uncharacterized protein n=1 Tax=Petromyces alliaceus TaxID=209559 RepID=UPI0012A569E2|nr:uncharacterized protein BDW43DRAFT_262097 [Aspergillus alliaceus]KAB8238588.1 hypothetical protein BDW43DRAFT_262097 [Aspergillus alliaceus]
MMIPIAVILLLMKYSTCKGSPVPYTRYNCTSFTVSVTGALTQSYHYKRLQPSQSFSNFLTMFLVPRPRVYQESHAYLDLSVDKSYFPAILADKERQRTNSTSITKLTETNSVRNLF